MTNSCDSWFRHLRLARSAKSPIDRLSAADCDSAEISLRASDQRSVIQVHEELHLICRYACERKETSKAAGVLILRFIHGYYPAEIARIRLRPGIVTAALTVIAAIVTEILHGTLVIFTLELHISCVRTLWLTLPGHAITAFLNSRHHSCSKIIPYNYQVLTWLLFVWAATTEGGDAAQFRRIALITPVGE